MESRNASRDTSARFDQYAGLIGKPYAHGADGPDAYDCFGACVKAVEIFYGYPVLPPRCTQDYAMNYCGWVEVSNAQQFTGDLILTYGNEGDHLWFRVSKDKLLTSIKGRGVVLVSNRAIAGRQMIVYRMRR